VQVSKNIGAMNQFERTLLMTPYIRTLGVEMDLPTSLGPLQHTIVQLILGKFKFTRIEELLE
jgi:hypothetical protein